MIRALTWFVDNRRKVVAWSAAVTAWVVIVASGVVSAPTVIQMIGVN